MHPTLDLEHQRHTIFYVTQGISRSIGAAENFFFRTLLGPGNSMRNYFSSCATNAWPWKSRSYTFFSAWHYVLGSVGNTRVISCVTATFILYLFLLLLFSFFFSFWQIFKKNGCSSSASPFCNWRSKSSVGRTDMVWNSHFIELPDSKNVFQNC